MRFTKRLTARKKQSTGRDIWCSPHSNAIGKCMNIKFMSPVMDIKKQRNGTKPVEVETNNSNHKPTRS